MEDLIMIILKAIAIIFLIITFPIAVVYYIAFSLIRNI